MPIKEDGKVDLSNVSDDDLERLEAIYLRLQQQHE
jgi:hypothetical protein